MSPQALDQEWGGVKIQVQNYDLEKLFAPDPFVFEDSYFISNVTEKLDLDDIDAVCPFFYECVVYPSG